MLRYDVRKMQELLKSFYTLSQIRIVVFDSDFRKITEYPQGDCAFCRIIRENPEADRRCAASDRDACEQCRIRNGLYTYTCHLGLSETVAPIRHGDMVIGYLMFGQALLRTDSVRHWQEIRETCMGWGLDESRLLAAYRQKQPVDLERLIASAKIMEACAGYLWLSRTISLQENSLPQKLYDHIMSHLNDDLSAKALCERFQISRSRLYRVSKEFFGCGIEEMIRSSRIRQAKELLEYTQNPIAGIAHSVGFSDYNYFIRVFRVHVGITPYAYRKAIK